jgi:hypothetical protein
MESAMPPAYILALIMLTMGLTAKFLKPFTIKKSIKIMEISILSLVLVLSAAFPIPLPVVNLSASSGAYSEGTAYISFRLTA